MAEAAEGNPATNFQKTVGTQNERVKAIEERSLGFGDKLVGQYTRGAVGAEYKKGEGGFVYTTIDSGRAIFHQNWRFDPDGKVSSVTIQKQLRGRFGGATQDVGTTRLVRDENGKFQVQEEMMAGSLPEWTTEFHTAKARMAAGRNRASTPPPAQK